MFVHLHVHTEYSLLDGAGRIEELAKAAASMGMPALAITDHGTMYGVIEFYKAARKQGIKPLIGCEVYVARRTRHDRTPQVDDSPHHLVLLAADDRGYRNLVRLVSRASLEGFYYKPRVDRELLAENSQGLIALSACLAGEIPEVLMGGDYGRAVRVTNEYVDIFGRENFYLELQDHNIPEQQTVNRQLLQLSKELGVGLVATNDAHYTTRDQAPVHDVLLCIQTGKTLDDANRLRFPSPEFYLKSPQEMQQLFRETPEALNATLDIASRCDVEFKFGKLYLPDYQLPEGYTDTFSYLRDLCYKGLSGCYPSCPAEVVERLEYELSIIHQMGFDGYFLIVWDLIAFARSKGIPVGPGRGSAAGSLVAYTLGITSIDPLRYELLFERFLNPERVTMPDIDTDFCFERRGEVIDYVTSKYGSDCVAQIVTFGTMAAKAAVRDVGRAMNIPLPEVDRVAKLIPNELGISIERSLAMSPELKELHATNPTVQHLLDMARALEGTPRHVSTHAAGVVISRNSLTNYLPVQKTSEGGVTTQFPMQTVEEIGLLKMDVLGLRTLTVIGDTIEIVWRSKNENIDLKQIPLDDKPTYQMLASGESTGVFQLESSGMRNILRNFRPEQFEELIALVALYRPGPLGSGMVEDFIQRKHGIVPVDYLYPSLEPILKETYGVILYQEQVMQIASALAGFSLGQADLLRRAMGKKKPEIILAQRENFITGALSRGVDASIAGTIFDLMEHFAGYGFNKSHSAAYALVAYQTAYLKAHYTVEFLAALMTSVMEYPDKIPGYIEECRRLSINVLPPDVNESGQDFTVVGPSIRFGLAAVKNVGRNAIEAIICSRDAGGRFASLRDFCERVDLRVVNRRVIESLIKSGAFASTGWNRAQLIAIIDQCLESGQRAADERASGQLSLLDLGPVPGLTPAVEAVPRVADYSMLQVLAMEKELLGFYLSGHPAEQYAAQLNNLTSHRIGELLQIPGDRQVTVGGVVTSVRRQVTKKGEQMAFFVLEDITGALEVIVFPRDYTKYSNLLAPDQVLLVTGKASIQEESHRLLAEQIQQVTPTIPLQLIIFLDPCKADRQLLEKIRVILHNSPGNSIVKLRIGQTGRALLSGSSRGVAITPSLQQSLIEILGTEALKVLPA